MIDYEIAIPSYKRKEILTSVTLPCLKKLKADFSKITIFTASQEENNSYREELLSKGLNIRIVTGVLGIGHQRIFINKYYKEGPKIFSIDDDIESLHLLEGKKLIKCPWSLDQIVRKGFSTCERVKARMWGVNPVFNPFFMKRTTTIGLRYIAAGFMGSYAQDLVWTDPKRLNFSSGEDFESTLRSFSRYKGVVRLDGICIKTKYFAKGGICDLIGSKEKRIADHKKKLIEITERYPKLAKTYVKADGTTNIRLRNITIGKINWSK